MRTLIILYLICVFCSCKKQGDPIVYIVSSNSNYTERAFYFSKELADSLGSSGEEFYFTHESMNILDILDGEWRGLENTKNLTLFATDERQKDPNFKKYYKDSYSSKSSEQINEVNKYFSKVCQNAGIKISVPFWETPKADSLLLVCQNNFSSNEIFIQYKERVKFLNQPNKNVLDLCVKATEEGKSCIVRYDEAHSFWLKRELEKRSMDYKYYYIGDPRDNFGKERKYFLLTLSASWVVGEF